MAQELPGIVFHTDGLPLAMQSKPAIL